MSTTEKSKTRAGIACSKCNGRRTDIIDTRQSPEGYLRRRRKCMDCGHRFSTEENTIIKSRSARHVLRDFLMDAEMLVQKYQNLLDKE